MTIEVVLLLGSLIWGGVQIVKHVVPTWYDRAQTNVTNDAHLRIDELEKKIEEIVGGAK